MNPVAGQQKPLIELRPWQHGLIFLLACGLLATRRPDALFHAQFWAEDGRVWFADAYNLGWAPALFHTWGRCFHTLPRLAAACALLAPLSVAPLLLNLVAIAAQALPVNLLLWSRSSVWGKLPFRALLAVLYLVLPNSTEMSCGITESEWLLALCAFLLLVASVPESPACRFFDLSLVLLSGLSGPFALFLLPLALFLSWKKRGRWQWFLAGLLAALSLIQILGMFFLPSGSDPFNHRNAGLGASPQLFARILAGHVYLGTVFGANWLANHPGRALFLFFVCVALAGTALVAVCFLKSAMEMKLFLVFSAMLFAASLLSSTGHLRAGVTAWDNLAANPGVRYWFFPTLAFAWSIAWLLRSRSAALKSLSAVLLCLMCFGIVRDWRHPAANELHFADDAARFAAAPPGTTVSIPENPEGWTIQLLKHER